jgi:hypothetical protein
MIAARHETSGDASRAMLMMQRLKILAIVGRADLNRIGSILLLTPL